LVVTKLDGSAKGGVVFALAKEFGLPIRYVGLGETAEDLRVFEPTAYVDGLLPATLGEAA
jgi:fused signal recognition particle receptor